MSKYLTELNKANNRLILAFCIVILFYLVFTTVIIQSHPDFKQILIPYSNKPN